jgi:hypothetical protein
VSCGIENYESLEFYGAGVILRNLVVKPLPGLDRLSGEIKGGGDNVLLDGIVLDRTLWGIKVGSSGGIVENCQISSHNQAIRLSGENTIIRNNTVTITSNNRAISAESGYTVTGNQVVENNLVIITSGGGADGVGAINIELYGEPGADIVSYVRNNTIQTNGTGLGLSAGIGNPPARIILEGNRYYSTHSLGGRAFSLTGLRSDGASSIIVRNNIFEGLNSSDVISSYNTDLITDGNQFGIYNNSFRIAGSAELDTTYNFMNVNSFYYEVRDTIPLYVVNNIFHGNAYSYFGKCQQDFAFFADYNIMHNFRGYIRDKGSIIGTGNDIKADPLYIDTDLHIDPASPAIDQGATPLLFEYIPGTDIDGIPRPQGSGYDMGAYEKEE